MMVARRVETDDGLDFARGLVFAILCELAVVVVIVGFLIWLL